MPEPVRLRVAPSPTGDPHVGTAYMSLFNLAFVRQQGGAFVLRVEDTDRARYVGRQRAAGLRHAALARARLGRRAPIAAGRTRRTGSRNGSTRTARSLERLLAEGRAYHCWCTPERLAEMRTAQQKAKQPTGYDRLCHGKTRDERAALPGFSEVPVVRMLIPDDPPLAFDDVIRGEVHAPRPDDQVILKADGFPTYHLAVVVDDHEMAITHVVRGEEWISSTPKHLLLYDWLGWERPAFAHMPLLRNADKSKISKRKNPAARLTWFREQGYLPEALRNFLALMGYSLPDNREIFTFEEMVSTFDWARVNTVGPVFDLDKLHWLNGHYIRELPADDIAERVVPYLVGAGVLSPEPSAADLDVVRRATPLVQERIGLLSGGRRDGRLPVRRRGRGRAGCGGEAARAGTAAGGSGCARRAREFGRLVGAGDRGCVARGVGGRARAQAEERVRAGAGCRHRKDGVTAAVRVVGVARTGAHAGPAGGGAAVNSGRPRDGVWGNWQPG